MINFNDPLIARVEMVLEAFDAKQLAPTWAKRFFGAYLKNPLIGENDNWVKESRDMCRRIGILLDWQPINSTLPNAGQHVSMIILRTQAHDGIPYAAFTARKLNVTLNVNPDDIEGRKQAFISAVEAVITDIQDNIDPTGPKGKYMNWILSMAVSGGYRHHEDLIRIKEALDIYERKKGSLAVELRDIKVFENILQLETAVSELLAAENAQKGQSTSALEQAGEIEILLQNKEYLVAITKTYNANCILGVNTQWCTRSKYSDEQFISHHRQGPLIVIRHNPTNRRWQYHYETKQFMDERDEPIDINQWIKDHPVPAAVLPGLKGGEEKEVYNDNSGFKITQLSAGWDDDRQSSQGATTYNIYTGNRDPSEGPTYTLRTAGYEKGYIIDNQDNTQINPISVIVDGMMTADKINKYKNIFSTTFRMSWKRMGRKAPNYVISEERMVGYSDSYIQSYITKHIHSIKMPGSMTAIHPNIQQRGSYKISKRLLYLGADGQPLKGLDEWYTFVVNNIYKTAYRSSAPWLTTVDTRDNVIIEKDYQTAGIPSKAGDLMWDIVVDTGALPSELKTFTMSSSAPVRIRYYSLGSEMNIGDMDAVVMKGWDGQDDMSVEPTGAPNFILYTHNFYGMVSPSPAPLIDKIKHMHIYGESSSFDRVRMGIYASNEYAYSDILTGVVNGSYNTFARRNTLILTCKMDQKDEYVTPELKWKPKAIHDIVNYAIQRGIERRITGYYDAPGSKQVKALTDTLADMLKNYYYKDEATLKNLITAIIKHEGIVKNVG